MSETAGQDISDLWSIYQTTKTQLEAVAAEKLAVLTQLTNLRLSGSMDATSHSESDEVGSESYTIIALQERFDSLTKAEIDLSNLMHDQRLLAIKSRRGFVRRRVGHRGGW